MSDSSEPTNFGDLNIRENMLDSENESLVSDRSSCSRSPSTTQEDSHSMAILDGTFFKVIPEKSNNLNIVAQCMKCEPDSIPIKGYKFSSSNFLSHLRRKHGGIVVNEYKTYALEKRKSELHSNTHPCKKLKQSLPITITQSDFNTKITQFVVSAMVPFQAVENEHFKQLLAAVGVDGDRLNVPSRSTVVRKAQVLFEKNNTSLKEKLKDVEFVCTSADIWSGRKKSFFGVTVHWIDENYQRKSAALACRRFKQTHSYDKIAYLLRKIHLDFGLNPRKIVSTITDNGSNFVKAFKLFGVDRDVIQRSIEYEPQFPVDVVTEDQRDAQDYSSESDDSSTEGNSDSVLQPIAAASTMSRTQSRKSLSDNVEQLLPNHLRCGSHTLNLCATTDLIKGLKKHPQLLKFHKNVIAKCNVLWNYASRPKTAEVLQEILGHTLSRPGDTRWNSLYDALKQIAGAKNQLPELYRQLKTRNSLDEDDLVYIDEYLSSSAPLATFIDVLQNDEDIFFGILLPSLIMIRRNLLALKHKEEPLVHCLPIIDIYLDSIEERFDEFYTISSPSAEMAAVAALSHPAFKKTWLQCIDTERHEFVLRLFKSAVVNESFSENIQSSAAGDHSKNVGSSKYAHLFDFGGNAREETSAQHRHEAKAEMEITTFFCDRSMDFKSLEAFPAIKRVFLRSNTSLPSSAPVERLFSFASMTNRPKANRLSDSNFEMRVVLKANGFKTKW